MSFGQKLADLPHVLVVDDDERIRGLVVRYLQENGFVACEAAGAAEAEALLPLLEFDALVVDVMMPEKDGFAFTRDLRKTSDIPVLLLTALGESENRIAGFESGADDYLPKPFEPRELVLRLQAILRRRLKPLPASAVEDLRIGRWRYDSDLKELRDEKRSVRLTAVEDNLLMALARRSGEVVDREELAALCGLDAEKRTIDVQVTRLRSKLEDDPKMPLYLQTVRGKGYKLLTGER